MLHQCSGVCRGEESLTAHQARLFSRLSELQISCWPYAGAVGVIERFEELFEIHVIRNWAYLGSATSMDEAKLLDSPAPGFDADGYKILCKPILAGTAEVVSL
jgi:excinuclease Cho